MRPTAVAPLLPFTLAGLLLVAAPAANAADDAPVPDPQACGAIEADAQRLACYDAVFVPPVADQAPTSPAQPAAAVPGHRALFAQDRAQRPSAVQAPDTHRDASARSLLDSRWELDPDSKLGTYNLRGYKPMYLLPVFYTTRPNNHPSSPAPGHSLTEDPPLDRLEAKFQLSFKTKLWQGVFGDHGDLWFGYTQSSHWQVYNNNASRPFRETDYEPEFLLVFKTNYGLGNWRGRLFSVGLNHQSNGRSNPRSRSWNRVVANFGFERPGWTVMVTPWVRIHESAREDDNPGISDYMGRAEATIVREVGEQEIAMVLRHSLRTGSHSHGSVRASWSFPIHAKLRGYIEVFNGYGESLIDYNHNATYAGAGVSLLGWY